MKSVFFNHNGKITPAGEAVIGPDNRGFRYGDGLFETIRVTEGEIELFEYHFERLNHGLGLLNFEPVRTLDFEHLRNQILVLCKKNGHATSARVRLAIYRGDGGLFDPKNLTPNVIIQSWDLPKKLKEINSNGLQLAVFPDGRKSCDAFSRLKSANFLLYAMAALYAKRNLLNDALILNMYERICETTNANIFIITNQQIFTPPLSEGCIAGVMRRKLFQQLPAQGYTVIEKKLSIEDINDAQEIFLSNAIHGLRWVQTIGDCKFTNTQSREIYHALAH